MAEVADSATTISELSGPRLVQIFQHVPIIERMKLRRVCKTWKNNIDHCWSFAKNLLLIDSLPEPTTITFTNEGELRVSTKNVDLLKGCTAHSAPYMKSLTVRLVHRDHDVQLLKFAAERCRYLQRLDIAARTAACDTHLCTLLRNNPNIEKLQAQITNGCCYKFLNVPLPNLEELCLTIDSPEMFVTSLAESRSKFAGFQRKTRNLIDGIKNLLAGVTLKKLKINYASPEVLKSVGGQIKLESLIILCSAMDGTVEFSDANILTKWHCLCKLGNLKEIVIYGLHVDQEASVELSPHSQPVTDEFVKEMVQCCPLLEAVTLSHWKKLTERSVSALSTLQHLKKLMLFYFRDHRGITGESLINCSSIETLYLTGCEAVGDAGIIGLLRNCQTIRRLVLCETGVTNDTLIAAVEETKKRTTGVKLTINVERTRANPSAVENSSPLLEISDAASVI